MSLVAVTLRRDAVAGREEERDALEASWWDVFDHLGHRPLLLPNHIGLARSLIEEHRPSAVLLTGGGTATPGRRCGRDEVERMLITFAEKHDRPLLGVCRGMQTIVHAFGGHLISAAGHVGRSEDLHTRYGEHRALCFHEQAIGKMPEGFRVLARSGDASIEAIEHEDRPIRAIMWHPERSSTLTEADTALVSDSLQS